MRLLLTIRILKSCRLFGVTQTLFGVVSVVGPVLGGYLVESMKFKGMLMVAAVLYVLATILRVGMAREARRKEANPTPLTFGSLKTNLELMMGLIMAGGLFTWIWVTDGVRDIFLICHLLSCQYICRILPN